MSIFLVTKSKYKYLIKAKVQNYSGGYHLGQYTCMIKKPNPNQLICLLL